MNKKSKEERNKREIKRNQSKKFNVI